MTRWLSGFGVPIPDNLVERLDSSFLALLYRLLPETERGLRLGLVQEVRAAEIGLEKLSKTASRSSEARLTAVARALVDAGFNINELRPSDHPERRADQSVLRGAECGRADHFHDPRGRPPRPAHPAWSWRCAYSARMAPVSSSTW